VKAHLLYADRDFDWAADLPPNHQDLIQDLELSTLLQAMALGDKFLLDVATRVVLAGLDNPDAILYRQRVLADCIAEPEIVRQMYSIAVGALEDKRGFWGYSSQVPSSILSGAVSQLESGVARLRELRKIADEHMAKFRSDGFTTLFDTLQDELDDAYFERVNYHLKQLRFRGGELISAELDRDNSGINFVLRSPLRAKPSWKQRLGFGARSSYSFAISPRDEAGSQAISELTSRGVNLVANAAAQSADHIVSYLTMLRAELGFYLTCLNARDRLVAKGQPTSFPEPHEAPSRLLTTGELCDVSLALSTDRSVVGNDVDADGKSLVIVTGANSGGKSTFLRSVGLAQLMMQSGMFVTAESYRASISTGVFTHFIREEDATMTSGRLDEELSRLSVIADRLRPHSLVLFNESFAATNEREGSEIGRQVVRALLGAAIRVVFVTHQFDFAESFHRQHPDTTVFLLAERQHDGRRSYKLAVAAPLPTSFGEDIYYRLGGWLNDDRPGDLGARPGPADDTCAGAGRRPGDR
jgi:DNA mismatch repair ATPase MutS